MATATSARAFHNIRNCRTLIGGAINAVLVGQADPKTAMDDIQSKAEALFK